MRHCNSVKQLYGKINFPCFLFWFFLYFFFSHLRCLKVPLCFIFLCFFLSKNPQWERKFVGKWRKHANEVNDEINKWGILLMASAVAHWLALLPQCKNVLIWLKHNFCVSHCCHLGFSRPSARRTTRKWQVHNLLGIRWGPYYFCGGEICGL